MSYKCHCHNEAGVFVLRKKKRIEESLSCCWNATHAIDLSRDWNGEVLVTVSSQSIETSTILCC